MYEAEEVDVEEWIKTYLDATVLLSVLLVRFRCGNTLFAGVVVHVFVVMVEEGAS